MRLPVSVCLRGCLLNLFSTTLLSSQSPIPHTYDVLPYVVFSLYPSNRLHRPPPNSLLNCSIIELSSYRATKDAVRPRSDIRLPVSLFNNYLISSEPRGPRRKGRCSINRTTEAMITSYMNCQSPLSRLSAPKRQC